MALFQAQFQAQEADWDDDSFLRLYLTTLAGTVIQMQVPVSIHHTWEMLEEYLVEHVPRNSFIDTFGCELTSINADTQMALQDPIQEDLWKNNHFNLVAHDCFRTMENNKHLQGLDYEDCPRESLTHKLLTENQKLSCSKHLVSQVSQRPESKTEEKAGKRHAHFSPHT